MRTSCSRTWRSRLLLVLGATLGTLVLLELGFRTYDALAQGLPFWWDPAAAAKKRTQLCNPFLLFRGTQQDWTTRAKTPEQVIVPDGRKVIRIVCLGGSTTQDATAFFEGQVTYPTELQRLLNEELGPSSAVVVETINAGFASHSTLHMLILLETELLALKPDLVIVYENINDLLVNYFPGPATPVYANKFLHPFYMPPEMTVEKTTWLDHSRLFTWARDRVRAIVWYDVEYTDDPVELRHEEAYRTNLWNIAAVAKAHGIPVAFGQQAMVADRDLFELHFKTKSYNRSVRYPRIDQLTQHFERYNAIVREVAAEQNAPCADPYAILKVRPDLFADVVHVHPEGARIVAREFARTLIESGRFREIIEAKRDASAKRR